MFLFMIRALKGCTFFKVNLRKDEITPTPLSLSAHYPHGCDTGGSRIFHGRETVTQQSCLFWSEAVHSSRNTTRCFIYHQPCGLFGFDPYVRLCINFLYLASFRSLFCLSTTGLSYYHTTPKTSLLFYR
jgi:hypothetical protein